MSQPLISLPPMPNEVQEAINDFGYMAVGDGLSSLRVPSQKFNDARAHLVLAIRRALAGAGQPTLPKEPSEGAVKAARDVVLVDMMDYPDPSIERQIRLALRAAYAVDAAPQPSEEAFIGNLEAMAEGFREASRSSSGDTPPLSPPSVHPDALAALDRVKVEHTYTGCDAEDEDDNCAICVDLALIRAALSGQKEEAP